jgi:putative ABC transport system permease protein
VNVIGRALGSLPDAAWIRRQFTLDADAVRDAAHGARMLLKTPGFTAIAFLIFATGIGATTAIVSVADALFMRRLAVPQPERVMTVWQYNRETGLDHLDVAPGNAIDWLTRARSFESIAMAEPFRFNINFAGRDPDYVFAARVSVQFFTALGTPVLHGRTFLPQEYQRGGPRVIVISHAMWRERFGRDPAIVGKALQLDDGASYVVVGVLPPGLELRLFDDRARLPEPQVWLPKQGFDQVETTLRGQG